MRLALTLMTKLSQWKPIDKIGIVECCNSLWLLNCWRLIGFFLISVDGNLIKGIVRQLIRSSLEDDC